MKNKTQINPAISSNLKELLVMQSHREQVPYSQIVESALNDYLNPDSIEKRRAILLKRLDVMSRQIENLNCDLTILGEAFVLFVRNYLATMPEVSKEESSTFIVRKESQFSKFMEALSESLEKGNCLANRLPQDMFLNEQVVQDMLKEEATNG